jgi:hypothetical protein
MFEALRQLDGDFDTVTYYGNGQWGEIAAKELGWRFVAVGQKLGGLARFQPHGSLRCDLP